jgi:hypothetical protein
MGLEGVAWGTVIPSLFTQLIFWPRHIARTLNVPAREYLWQGWIRSAIAVTPFGFACYLADRMWPSTGMLNFFTQMLVLLPLLPLGIALTFWKELTPSQDQTAWLYRRWDAALHLLRRAQ